jgi:hypothetical protein
MIRLSYTAIVERNREFAGAFSSEPYECGWASEAIFFFRTLNVEGDAAGTTLRVQISPDGMRWCDEGAVLTLTDRDLDFCRVTHFGNWLRLAGELPEGARVKAIVSLCLKE